MKKRITNDKIKLLKDFFKNNEIRVNGKPLIFPSIGQDPQSKIISITAESQFCLCIEPKDEVIFSSDRITIKNNEEEIVFVSSIFTEDEKVSFVFKENILDFLFYDWDMFSIVNEYKYNEDVKRVFDVIMENIKSIDVINQGKNVIYDSVNHKLKAYLFVQDEKFYFRIESENKSCNKKELSILLSDFLEKEVI